jgi:murein tripeptide amidase MpaA
LTFSSSAIDNEQPKKERKALDWTFYWTYDQTAEWMKSLVVQYPSVVSLINIGKSYEGRDLFGVKLNFGGGEKKSVMFEGTIHAREWISAPTVTWMVNELLTSTDPEVQEIAKNYEWIAFPITNPDGYEYSWTTDRMWRKTRKPSNLICFGVDPNHNWDNHFNEAGTFLNPCTDAFAGSGPFSEPETKQLSDYIKTIPQLTAYFSFHSAAQMLMFPYGWTEDLVENYQELYEIAAIGVEALKSKFNTHYDFGSVSEVLCECLRFLLNCLETSVLFHRLGFGIIR